MRETLTFLAAAILAVLALALAVPPFVDWSAFGPRLGQTFGDMLGADVRLGGPIAVRLLPSPRFEVGAVRVARPGLDVEADGAAFELALAPLLRGVVSVASARLERPRVSFDPQAAKGVAMPAGLGFERLFLRDATFALKTPHGTRQLAHVDLIASADSIAGPYKAEGFLRADSRLLPFRLATGAIADKRLVIKGEIDPLAGLPKAEATGAVIWDGPDPRFNGIVTLAGTLEGVGQGNAPLPWHARIDGTANADEAHSNAIELRVGDDTARLVASGTGRLDTAGLSLTLWSERPDLDRFRTTFDPTRIASALGSSALAGAPVGVVAIDWRAGAGVLGGAVANDLHLAVLRTGSDPPGRAKIDMSLALPRNGFAAFAGAIDATPMAAGDVVLRGDDASALTRWLATLVPSFAQGDPPFERIDLRARIDAKADRIEASDLRASLDRSVLSGHASFTPARSKTPARVEATLSAQALDIDALPELSRWRAATDGVDLALTFDARAIKVARVGTASVEAGRVGLSLTRTGGAVDLERLTLDNFAGATAQAKGRLTNAQAHFDATLDAGQLGEFAALLRRVAPGPLADAFASRARILSPAKVDVALDATAIDDAYAPTSLTLAGKAADTDFRVTLAPMAGQPRNVTGTLVLDAPEAANLLRQAGVPVIPLRGQGAGHFEAKLSGEIGAPLTVIATGTLAGARLVFDGRARFDSQAREAEGALKLSARDLGPLLRVIAAPVDSLARWPAELLARIDARIARVALSEIAGQFAGTSVSGALSQQDDAPTRGALHLGQLDLPSLAKVLLGALPPPQPGKPFSPLKWPTQPNDPPSATIDLAVDRLDLGTGQTATNATAKLLLGPGEIAASDATMTLAGGSVTGAINLRRREDTASLSASLTARDVALTLPWLAAKISGRAKIAGAGTSAAGLVGSLAGEGALRLVDAKLARADPDAVGRVAQAVDAERIDLAPAVIEAALARELDAASQVLPALEQPLAIEAGQVTLAPFDLVLGDGRATLDARFDLANDRVTLREALRPAPPRFWSGAPPAVTLTFAGAHDAPRRSIDATDLVGTLADHGMVREAARIAAIEADQRERAFFNRRLKFDRVLDAARKAEEARLEAERLEAVRQEALREAARQNALREAARQEVLRQEAARQEAARLERERRAAERALQAPAGTAPGGEPLDLRSPAARSGSGFTPGIIAPDPGAAGRY